MRWGIVGVHRSVENSRGKGLATTYFYLVDDLSLLRKEKAAQAVT